MDTATLVGLLLGIVGVFGGNVMEGGSPSALINIPGFMIVIVGSLGTGIMSVPMETVKKMPKPLGRAFKQQDLDPAAMVPQFEQMADRVTAFAAAGLSERWRTSLAGRPVRVLVAADRVLVSLALSGELAILDLATGAVLSMVPVGLLPDGIAVEASGRYAFVASAGSDRVVALAAGTVVGELPAGDGPSGLLWVAEAS